MATYYKSFTTVAMVYRKHYTLLQQWYTFIYTLHQNTTAVLYSKKFFLRIYYDTSYSMSSYVCTLSLLIGKAWNIFSITIGNLSLVPR